MLARSRLIVALLLALLGPRLLAATPTALPEGKLPNDVRLQPPKDLERLLPVHAAASRPKRGTQRAEQVKRQMLVSQGLWPMPTKTPLNAVIHGKVDRDDYTVEKVYFESYPGFFVTGNLYRPEGTKRQAARRALPARPLAQRPASSTRATQAMRKEIVAGRRAVRGRRPQPAASPLRAARPDGLRRAFTTT